MNPVPLNYFKQFPDHVATGFTYLTAGIYGIIGPTDCLAYSTRDLATNKPYFVARTSAYFDSESAIQPCLNFKSFSTNQHMPNFEPAASPTSYPALVLPLLLLGDELSWFFEDDDRRKHAPHSLIELYSWYHYGIFAIH